MASEAELALYKALDPNQIGDVSGSDQFGDLSLIDEKPTQSIPTAPVGIGEKFGAGVKAGVEGMGADLQYFAALGNTLLGDEKGAAERIREARMREEFAGNAMAGLETFGQFVDNPTFSGFMDQVITSVGQVTPSLVTSLAGGLTGVLAAVGGKAVLSKGGKAVTQKMLEDIIAKQASGQVLDQAEQEALDASYGFFRQNAKKIGGALGLSSVEYPMMAGGSFAEFEDAGVELTPERAFQAALIGGAQTAVSVGGEMFVLGKLMDLAKTKAVTDGGILAEFGSRTALGAGTTAASEGITEGIQEGMNVAQRLAVDEDYSMEEAQLRIGQAVFTGAFGAGPIGAVGGAATTVGARGQSKAAEVFDRAKQMVEETKNSQVAGDIQQEQLGIQNEDISEGTTTVEADLDILTQIGLTLVDDSAKKAAWATIKQGVPEGQSPNQVFEYKPAEKDLRGEDTPAVYAAIIPGRGTIFSPDREIVQEVIRSGASEESLRDALGYSAVKPEGADLAVQVVNTALGTVVHEEATNQAGLRAAQEQALKIAPSSEYEVRVVSIQQAMEERAQRAKFEIQRAEQAEPEVRQRSMLTDEQQQVAQEDEFVDQTAEAGAFATEEELGLQQEGMQEFETPLDEAETIQTYATLAPGSTRKNPEQFERNWARVIQFAKDEERETLEAFKPIVSESMAKRMADVMETDRESYYFVENAGSRRNPRLAFKREPSFDERTPLGRDGEPQDLRVQDRVVDLVRKLIPEEITTTRRDRQTGKTTQLVSQRSAATANNAYFFRGEQGKENYWNFLRKNNLEHNSEEQKRFFEVNRITPDNFKTVPGDEVFTIIDTNPDSDTAGLVLPIPIGDVIVAGKEMNQIDGSALVGEGLSMDQANKAGLLRGLAELRIAGYEVEFAQAPLDIETGSFIAPGGDLGWYSLELAREFPLPIQPFLNTAAEGISDRYSTRRYAELFEDLIIFQQRAPGASRDTAPRQYSLKDLLEVKDTIPLESTQADAKLAAVDEQIDQLIEKEEKWLEKANFLGRARGATQSTLFTDDLKRELKRDFRWLTKMDMDFVQFAFDRSRTEGRNALSNIIQSREHRLQILEELRDQDIVFDSGDIEGTTETDTIQMSPVIEPRVPRVGRPAPTPEPAPEGINPETGEPFARSGALVNAPIELRDQIEEGVEQEARAAGVFDAQMQEEPERVSTRLIPDFSAVSRSELREWLATGNPPIGNDGARNIPTKTKVQMGTSRNVSPTRILIEDAPATGGFTGAEADARGGLGQARSQAELGVREALAKEGLDPDRARTVEVFGTLGELTNRVFAKAQRHLALTKPITVFTLSELQQNLQQYAGEGQRFSALRDILVMALNDFEFNPDSQQAKYIGTGNRHIIIVKDVGEINGDADFSDSFIGATLGHELGHALFEDEFQLIRDAEEGTPEYVLKNRLWKEYKDRYFTTVNGKVVPKEDTPSQYTLDGYGFEEFFADQVGVKLYNLAKAGPTTPKNRVERYFKDLADRLLKFFKDVNDLLNGRFTPNKVFQSQYLGDETTSLLKAHRAKLRDQGRMPGVKNLGLAQQFIVRDMVEEIRKAVPSKVIAGAKRMANNVFKSKGYGFISKYAVASDNYLRSMGAAGVGIAQFFNQQSASLEKMGFHRAKAQQEAIWVNRLAKALGIDPQDKEAWTSQETEEILQIAEDETVDTETLTGPAREVRELFQKFFTDYLTGDNGEPFFHIFRRKNYTPRQLNFAELEVDEELQRRLVDLIVKYDPSGTADILEGFTSDPDAVRKQAVKDVLRMLADSTESADVPVALDEIAKKIEAGEQLTQKEMRDFLEGLTEDDDPAARLSPGMANSLTRKLNLIPTKELRENGLLVPASLAVPQYFHFATRKAEFEKRGGQGRIDELIKELPEEHREAATSAVLGNLGRMGIGMKPWIRNLNSAGAVATALTTLLFTTFASFTDLAGPIIRTRDFQSLGMAFNQMRNAINTSEGRELARTVGAVAPEALSNLVVARGELDFMNDTSRMILDKWFQYTGLQLYTRFSREFASLMGREWLVKAADMDMTDTLKRQLTELGITQADLKKYFSGEGQRTGNKEFDSPEGKKVRDAILTFVDESIVRPNPAERPMWASDPTFVLLFQLKSYFYSYGKTVLGGIGREIKNRYREDGDFEGGGMLILLAATALLPLTAVGLEFKELARWLAQIAIPGIEASDRTFRTDNMSTPEYMWELFEKSGALGPWSIPVSALDSWGWGDNPLVSQVPVVDLFDDTLMDGDWLRPIPVLNNVQ